LVLILLLDGLVYQYLQRTSLWQESNQQPEQDLRGKPAVPYRSVDDPVIVGEVAFLCKTHGTQG
jgi:hypothetical protein